MRTPSPSPMRPKKPVDQTILLENRKLVHSIERRALLRGGLSLGALTMLTGCDISNRDSVQSVLQAMSAWNDRVQAFQMDAAGVMAAALLGLSFVAVGIVYALGGRALERRR